MIRALEQTSGWLTRRSGKGYVVKLPKLAQSMIILRSNVNVHQKRSMVEGALSMIRWRRYLLCGC